VKVGVGMALITPETMPVHLAGFGEPQVAHEVRDDLEVRAVYLSNGDVSVCLLVCDLLGMTHHYANPVRDAVGAALGLGREAVLTSSVHTHAGPSAMAGTEILGWHVPDGYGELLAARCTDAALAARAAAVDDVTFRFGRWPLPPGLSINRRGHPYDPWFTALDVLGASGERVTTIANIAIHPVVLGPECLAVSSDWVGAFRIALEQRLGGRAVMLQGAQGDVNPHHVHRQNNECGRDLFAEADELGASLAEAVDAVIGSAEEVPVEGPSVERHHTFDAPTDPSGRLAAALGRPSRVELVEWALGPVRVVSIPGEAFHALGRAVEDRAGGRVLIAGLAPTLQGYLPVPWNDGGYEEDTSYGRSFVEAVTSALLST
jgi:hypothetical protein